MSDETLTPQQFVRKFSQKFAVDPYEAVLYLRLAAHFFSAEFYNVLRESGQPVRHSDPMGTREWFTEIENACAAEIGHPRIPPKPSLRADEVCPVCFHVHEQQRECGKYLGEAKFCRCEQRMTA